jgi:hypothetical protein
MASLNRPKFATYVINEKVTIDTTDREDHTFCGIAFPIQCKAILPVEHIIISSISVRGDLGPVTVWVTKENDEAPETAVAAAQNNNVRAGSVRYNIRQRGGDTRGKRGQMIMKQKYWNKIYEQKHKPSRRNYCELDLGANPIILKPGEIRGIYIHSTLETDKAIVYDNQQQLKTFDDQFLTVLPGRSHVSPDVFGTDTFWGRGSAWRDNREFVGKVSYGVVYKLWNPVENLSFGGNFRHLARVLFMCQRRWESPFSMLSDDCIFYILNMCRWDWMADTFDELRAHKKKMRELEASSMSDDAVEAETVAEANADMEDVADEEDDDGDDDEDEQEQGIPNDEDMEVVEEGSTYDSDYADSDEESGSDDGYMYGDHNGSSAFQYNYYDDDGGSSDEEREAEAYRVRQASQRRQWLINHFGHQFVQAAEGADSD